MNTRYFISLGVVLLVIGVLASWYVLGQRSGDTELLGGDRDVHGCIGSAGYSWCEEKQKCLRPWEEQCEAEAATTTSSMTEAAARAIAERECIKGGEALAVGYYNDNSKTWWFDANLNATKPGCNPACVVSEETGETEINWRCTGAVPPGDDTTSMGTVSGQVSIGPFCPVEREGVPCDIPVEAYTSRSILVYESDKTTIKTQVSLAADGTYTLSLASGTYWLQVEPAGIGPGELKPVTVTAGGESVADFDVDTGIR